MMETCQPTEDHAWQKDTKDVTCGRSRSTRGCILNLAVKDCALRRSLHTRRPERWVRSLHPQRQATSCATGPAWFRTICARQHIGASREKEGGSVRVRVRSHKSWRWSRAMQHCNVAREKKSLFTFFSLKRCVYMLTVPCSRWPRLNHSVLPRYGSPKTLHENADPKKEKWNNFFSFFNGQKWKASQQGMRVGWG